MGKRTGAGQPPSQPQTRQKTRSPFWTLVRIAGWIVVVGALLFVASGFYYSNVIRDGALIPPESYDREFNLSITAATGDQISITDTGSDGQMGQPGVQGIEWDGGYLTTVELISSIEDESGDTTDIRRMSEGGIAPGVGTEARLDPNSFPVNPEQAFGIPFETITYPSDVGNFPAWFIDGSSETWAIIVHGKGADATEALRIIPVLHALNYPILVIHYRNDPGSASDPSGYHRFGATEWRDVHAAVLYAEENGSADHILVGYSMGGSTVTSFLTQSQLRNRTRAAILDSPALDFEATIDYQAAQTTLPVIGVGIPSVLSTFSKWIASWRFDIDWDKTNYLEQTGELHAPMLIFHGSGDTSVPLATSRRMAQLRPDITTLVETKASHVRSWNESPEAYETAIEEFLADR